VASAQAGPYYDAISAQPAEYHEDPLDPQQILRELPDPERANFLAAYREALNGARDLHLRRRAARARAVVGGPSLRGPGVQFLK